ncbi:MAG: CRISPR-associated protein Cas4 [Brooklawnia sp.]|jgi:CRISPR-associated exonuclease Cas4
MRDPLPLSIVEHYAFCPRQAALIHIESQWSSNADTAQGEADHAAVDRGVRSLSREGTVIWSSLPVWSETYRLQGICDVVEFRDGLPVPVEHKPKLHRRTINPAAQQVAAQALCLEEMFDCRIDEGFLFTRKDHRRHLVSVNDWLRQATRSTIKACHELVTSQLLPPPVSDARCKSCSLAEPCGVLIPSEGLDRFTPRELGDW